MGFSDPPTGRPRPRLVVEGKVRPPTPRGLGGMRDFGGACGFGAEEGGGREATVVGGAVGMEGSSFVFGGCDSSFGRDRVGDSGVILLGVIGANF